MLRPITVNTGRVRAPGHVANVGMKIGMAEGALRDSGGRILALGYDDLPDFSALLPALQNNQ